MNTEIEALKKAIESLRKEIIEHKVYAVMNELEDLRIFMQYHVFAVWDFMSLLKTLQNNLTCTTVPWYPKGNADTRKLINEIVLGEEADLDSFGNNKSHFEIYLDAMEQCAADTGQIKTFLAALKSGSDLEEAFTIAGTPVEAVDFVNNTFDVIKCEKDYLQAAIFTFGREDLIPGMFISIVNDLEQKFPDSISIFKYYLERHIAVDGDLHSHLALQMTSNLCGTDETRWKEATAASILSLQKRINLWNGAYDQIIKRK